MHASDELPVRSPRRFLPVAQALLAAVSNGAHPPGSTLPSHSEVAARAGVSRATAREALLALELLGVVEVRHGDGTYVRDSTGNGLRLAHSRLRATSHELIEARLHIEPVMAGLAAARSSADQQSALARLVAEQRTLVDQPLEVPRFVALGLRFHAVLAAAAGNSLLAGVVEQLVDVERHPLWALINQHGMTDSRARQLQVLEHAAIADAITQGSSASAAQAMRVHLDELDATMASTMSSSSEVAP